MNIILIFLLLICRALSIMTFNMETKQFGYSTKNIPIPPEKEYRKMLIEKTENLCRRMRWKAHFSLNPDIGRRNKECYGFNSTKSPPHISELENFESKMLEMIKNVEFKQVHCKFQKKLSTDIKNIKNTKSMFVPADKTTNFYKMGADRIIQRITSEKRDEIVQENTT